MVKAKIKFQKFLGLFSLKDISIISLSMFFFFGSNIYETSVSSDTDKKMYVQEIEKWRAEREKSLRKDTGWLTLVGLYLLKEGDNRFGSDPDNDIVFPEKAPSHAGVFRLIEGKVNVEVDSGIKVRNGNEEVQSIVMVPDTEEETTLLDLGSFQFHILERVGKWYVRLKDRESKTLLNFKGIKNFPIHSCWRIKARFQLYDPPKKIRIPNYLGYDSEDWCPGAVVFKVEGKEYRLEPMVETGGELFFVFGDRTNGKETYGGGRFLYADPPDSNGIVILDFNKSYNPPCVFTPYATCPLPRPENILLIRIKAGEKTYERAH